MMETDIVSARFNQIASKYDEQRRYFIPGFDDFYKTGISLVLKIRREIKSILDLGAGTGLLTKYLFDNYPDARFTLVDVSDKMLDIARQRFSGMENFKYVVSDYSERLPGNNFDLIASALSIHHLTDESKLNLYYNVYDRLDEKGLFLNLDQFNAETELINKCYNELWYDYLLRSNLAADELESWRQRRELDRENSISDTLNLLNKARFKTVECIYSNMKFGVILAMK